MKIVEKINNSKKSFQTKCAAFIVKIVDSENYTKLRETNRNELLDEIRNQYSQTISIVNPLVTLAEIEKTITSQHRGAYMRFGDGDAYLAAGLDDSYQQASAKLSEEMEETFLLNGEFVFKCLSIHSKKYGYEKEMYLGNHLVKDKLANKLLGLTFQYFVGHKIYSPISLHFTATYSPETANHFLRKLKEDCILFIGNQSVPHETVKLLFGDVPHVKTPSENAYTAIDKIEKQSLEILNNTNRFGTVVVAMGCSGRPLMKRLFNNKNLNIFLFDFGSLLDGICGDKSRAWLKKEDIDYDVLLKDL